jgi:REP element-mobilizing transposase RayT
MNTRKKPPDRKSVRLTSFDYRTPTGYFVTICAQHHRPLFGQLRSGQVVLSPLGEIVQDIWNSLNRHHHVIIDESVVMPNHFHGIIFLRPDIADAARCVPTKAHRNISRGSLSVVIRSFKSAVTKRAHAELGIADAIWQTRFHEHILQDNFDLSRHRRYIRNNPAQWDSDEENIDLS